MSALRVAAVVATGAAYWLIAVALMLAFAWASVRFTLWLAGLLTVLLTGDRS